VSANVTTIYLILFIKISFSNQYLDSNQQSQKENSLLLMNTFQE
jgi:hypothetical protein